MKKAIDCDTSAINWLYFDNEHERVIVAIRGYSFVQISVLIIAELGAHPMKEDRMGLLNLARDISCNFLSLIFICFAFLCPPSFRSKKIK